MTTLGELLADLTSGDSERAEAAAGQLPKHEDAALKELGQLIQDKDPDKRWWAARALASFQQPEAGDLLTSALGDADGSVRHCAALALSKRPHTAATAALIAALAHEDHLFARLAADALISLGREAVEALITALDTLPPNGKVEDARALALIADPRAIGALFKLADSDSLSLEHWVSEGLERMGVGMRFFAP